MEKVFYTTVYVDDLLILANQEELGGLKLSFTDEFRWIMIEEGKIHSYLSMQLSFETGQVKVNMPYYLKTVINRYSDLKAEGKEELVCVESGFTFAEQKRKQVFHTCGSQTIVFYLIEQNWIL